MAGTKKQEFEAAASKSASTLGDLAGFLGRTKKWWLIPILVTFLLLGGLLLFSGTVAAPFIYTLF